MKTCTFAVVALAALLTFAARWGSSEERVGEAGPQLGHMVFFTLADDTAESQKKLVEACHKYLDGHEGTVYFSVGTLAKDLDREVNDLEFDVALHLVFKDKAAHDTYQTHARHLEFIDKNKSLWSKVRVFDSYVAAEK